MPELSFVMRGNSMPKGPLCVCVCICCVFVDAPASVCVSRDFVFMYLICA